MSTQQSQTRSKRLLILGCGYLGVPLGTLALRRGFQVTATSTRQERLPELSGLGFEARLLDFGNPTSLELLGEPWAGIVCAAAPRGRSPDALVFGSGPVECARRAREAGNSAFLAISSTGVYHQNSGEWVDETSPAEPREERYRLLRAMEEEVRLLGGRVLRLGGLYGPGRSPVDWLRKPEVRGRLLEGSREAWMNWIRVEDAAELALCSIEGGVAGTIYLGTDGVPVRRGDFYAEAARQAGIAPPDLPSRPQDLGKRCDNRATSKQLGYKPRFAGHTAGLAGL